MTLAHVAAEAGVAVPTASQVLRGNARALKISPDTERRVRAVADRLGYQPSLLARTLKSGKSGSIGIIISADLSYGQVPWLTHAITDALAARGYRVPIWQFGQREGDAEEVLRSLIGQHIDGLIVMSPGGVNTEECATLLRSFLANGVPVVSWFAVPAGPVGDLSLPTFGFDRRTAYHAATEYLVSLGHRRVGLTANPHVESVTEQERIEGYRRALGGAGLSFDVRLCQSVNPEYARPGKQELEQGYLSASALWEAAQPTAILCGNDNAAVGVLRFAFEAGLKVPDDLSVMGWGDFPIASCGVLPLTTLAFPYVEIADWIAETLSTSIDTGVLPEPVEKLAQCPLIVRSSTGSPSETSCTTIQNPCFC